MSEANGLPKGWATATIGQLVGREGIFRDGDWVESKDQDPDGDVRLIQLADVGDGRYVDKSSRFLTHDKALELRCTFLNDGDVLVARMPDPLGRACIFPGDEKKSVTVVDVCVVRAKKSKVDHRWLMWFINAPKFRSAVASLQSGSTRKRISRKNLGTLMLPVPPPNEQQRIVAKIEELFSDLDAGVAALERAKANLKRYRAAVLKAAVEGKLTAAWRAENPCTESAADLLQRILHERRRKWEQQQIAKYAEKGKEPPKGWRDKYKPPAAPDAENLPELPDGWCWATVEQLIERSEYGTSVKCNYEASGAPVLRIPNIAGGKIELADMKFATKDCDLDEDSRLNVGDLLMCRTNGSIRLIGRSALVRAELDPAHAFASYLLRFRFVVRDVLPQWVDLFVSSLPGRNFIESNAASSAGQHNISLSLMHKMAVLLPPLAEQMEIVARSEEKESLIDASESVIDSNVKRAARLRQSILKRAFEGKLVPQDPTDESAGVLLERIAYQSDRANQNRKESTSERRKPVKRSVRK